MNHDNLVKNLKDDELYYPQSVPNFTPHASMFKYSLYITVTAINETFMSFS